VDKKKIFDFASKTFKDHLMGNEQNKERSKHAETIIRNHVIWSLGAGFIPIVAADVLAVSALQLDMIRQLCRVYDINFSETQGKAIVTSLTSSTIARLSATSVTKLIPVVGTILGGVTNSIFAGASTYALGEVFKKHFESGGTILDFDPDRLKKLYKEKFEKGKKVAQNLQRQDRQQQTATAAEPAAPNKVERESEPTPAPSAAPQSAVVARIKELAALRDEGIISDEEFQEMKRKVIDEFK
jgi:uncharacterized protein (DUF697 family)